MIPKTGTGEVRHKIVSYPTGEGEYHIVMEEIKASPQPSPQGEGVEQKSVGFVIAGEAKM